MVRLRVRNCPLAAVVIQFQFLYGAIKSIRFIINRMIYNDFNSCMVRLRVTVPAVKEIRFSHFNSCMVRLREFEKYRAVLTNALFQFLYGAIKSFQALRKEAGSNVFQFLYGAIKRDNAVLKKDKKAYFNSCMVRLRVPVSVRTVVIFS